MTCSNRAEPEKEIIFAASYLNFLLKKYSAKK